MLNTCTAVFVCGSCYVRALAIYYCHIEFEMGALVVTIQTRSKCWIFNATNCKRRKKGNKNWQMQCQIKFKFCFEWVLGACIGATASEWVREGGTTTTSAAAVASDEGGDNVKEHPNVNNQMRDSGLARERHSHIHGRTHKLMFLL